MKKLRQIIDVVHRKLTTEQWDNVWIVAGDEGTGKSNLTLWILEYYYTLLNGAISQGDIKHITLGIEEFTKDLADMKRYELTIWDEAGDMSNRRAMSNLNFQMVKTFQVVRGDNLFFILTLPSLWDLESFFTKRRARGLIYVHRRGHFAFWSRERLRKLVGLNQRNYIKNYWAVTPTFRDTFPKYSGVLLEPYEQKKAEKMERVRRELYEAIGGEQKDAKDREDEEIKSKQYDESVRAASESVFREYNEEKKRKILERELEMKRKMRMIAYLDKEIEKKGVPV